MPLVTFLGSPRMSFYRGSEAGTLQTWRVGDPPRDLSDEVTAALMRDFGEFFTVAEAKAPALAKTAAVKSPKAKAPATKKKAKKGKA